MTIRHGDRKDPRGRRRLKHFLVGGAGIFLGGVFLWLAMRNVDPAVVQTTLRQADIEWLTAGISFYLLSIGLRCLRWGILLRATGGVVRIQDVTTSANCMYRIHATLIQSAQTRAKPSQTRNDHWWICAAVARRHHGLARKQMDPEYAPFGRAGRHRG